MYFDFRQTWTTIFEEFIFIKIDYYVDISFDIEGGFNDGKEEGNIELWLFGFGVIISF